MSQALDPVTRHQIAGLTESLAGEFAGIFSRETIAQYISESADLLTGSKIVDFVPVLSYRFARERLKALGQAEGSIAKQQPEVLFVCVQNAGRSQMAAGLVRLRSEGRVHVRSAGSDPAENLNPAVVEAMTEIGVDLGEEFPVRGRRAHVRLQPFPAAQGRHDGSELDGLGPCAHDHQNFYSRTLHNPRLTKVQAISL